MGHALVQTGPLMGDDIRHDGPGKCIEDKKAGHHHQGRSQGSAGGFQQGEHADNGHCQIHGCGESGAIGQLFIKEKDVGRAIGRRQGHHPVLQRNIIPGRGSKRGIGGIGQKHGKSEMDGPGLGGVEDKDIKDKGQGRRVPELKKSPAQGNKKKNFFGDRSSGAAGSGFGLGNHLLQLRLWSGGFLEFAHQCGSCRAKFRTLCRFLKFGTLF